MVVGALSRSGAVADRALTLRVPLRRVWTGQVDVDQHSVQHLAIRQEVSSCTSPREAKDGGYREHHRRCVRPCCRSLEPRLICCTVDIEENGVRLRLTVVDTPGYGDFINNDDG